MKIIRLGIISFVVFFLLFTLISLFFPSHIRLSKAVDVNMDKQTLMKLIADTSGWKQWYPAVDSMPLTGISFTISDSTVQVTNKSKSNLSANSGFNLFNTPKPNTLTVQWYMDFYTGWLPWQKFSGLLLESKYGTMMEQGLDKLKNLSQ